MVELCAGRSVDQDKCFFTRRELRERTGLSVTQVRIHLARLTEFEYVAPRHGRNGASYVYELLIEANEPAGLAHIGLLDVEKLRLRHQPDGLNGRPDGAKGPPDGGWRTRGRQVQSPEIEQFTLNLTA